MAYDHILGRYEMIEYGQLHQSAEQVRIGEDLGAAQLLEQHVASP